MAQLPISVVNAIRKAIKDYPTDMLMRLPIVYRLKIFEVSRWNEEKGESYTNYNLLSLYVESDEKEDIVKESEKGSYDERQGYFLFNYDDLVTSNLIQNGLPIFNANVDMIVANGKTYEVVGVHPLGQLVDTYTMVKVNVRKVIKMV